MNLNAFIQHHVAEIEPLEHASNLAWWNQATTGKEMYAQQLKDAKIALQKIYASKDAYEKLKTLVPSSAKEKRQKELLLFAFQECQIPQEKIEEIVAEEVAVEEIYTNFRPHFQGKPVSNNEIKEVLLKSNHSLLRKEAWEASKEIGKTVEQKVLRLIALRNEAAHTAGFSDYYTMRLKLQEIDPTRLFEILQETEALTAPLWKHYKEKLDQSLVKRFGLSVKELQPWHYQDPFFQEAPAVEIDFDPFYQGKNIVEISRAFFSQAGFDIDDILARSDLFERENKSQHAFCMNIDRKQDVRILCNLKDNAYWMGTQLHELGHAVYDKYLDPSLPYLLRAPAHIMTTEASAMLFGRLSTDPDFIQFHTGKKAPQNNYSATSFLVFARWVLVMTHFEKAMYQRKDIDLNSFWWECVHRFQGVAKPEGRHAPDWASKIHLACAPVYYQNYLLGEMTASQLTVCLKKYCSGEKPWFKSPRVAEFLKTSLYSKGALLPWEGALMEASGERLNPAYFAQDIDFLRL